MTVAAGSGFGGKPRPALVLQSDAIATTTLVLALFTSELDEADPIRPYFAPSPANGLRHGSELMVDILITARREKIGRTMGRLTQEEMARADRAVLALLGLAS